VNASNNVVRVYFISSSIELKPKTEPHLSTVMRLLTSYCATLYLSFVSYAVVYFEVSIGPGRRCGHTRFCACDFHISDLKYYSTCVLCPRYTKCYLNPRPIPSRSRKVLSGVKYLQQQSLRFQSCTCVVAREFTMFPVALDDWEVPPLIYLRWGPNGTSVYNTRKAILTRTQSLCRRLNSPFTLPLANGALSFPFNTYRNVFISFNILHRNPRLWDLQEDDFVCL